MDVAVIRDGNVVGTRHCKGLADTRRFLQHIRELPGFDGLVVSHSFRESLRADPATDGRH